MTLCPRLLPRACSLALLAGVVSLGSSASADEPPAAAPAKDASGLVPGQSGGVPTPSPVVIGGKPVPIDRVAIPLAWTGSTFSTADWIISSTAGALTLGAAIAMAVLPAGWFGPRIAEPAFMAPVLPMPR